MACLTSTPPGTVLTPTPLLPLVWSQLASNRGCVFVCAHCACFVGSPQEQLVAMGGSAAAAAAAATTGPATLLPAADLASHGDAAETKVALAPVASSSPAARSFTVCDLGCGEMYCSGSCRDAAAFAGHARLCVGPHDEDHPLFDFKLRVMMSGAFDEFMLAAKLFVLAETHTDGRTKSGAAGAGTAEEDAAAAGEEARLQRAARAHEVWQWCASEEHCGRSTVVATVARPSCLRPWWDLVSPELDEEDADAWRESARDIVEGAWSQLQAGLGSEFAKRHDAVQFARLLAWIAGEVHEFQRDTPTAAYVRTIAQSPAAARCDAGPLLVSCARSVLSSMEDDEDDWGEGEGEGEGKGDDNTDEAVAAEEDQDDADDNTSKVVLNDAQLLARVLADPTRIVAPPLQLVAVYLAPRALLDDDLTGRGKGLPQWPHDCAPTCRVELNTNATTGASAGAGDAGDEHSAVTSASEREFGGPTAHVVAARQLAAGDRLSFARVDALDSVEERAEALQLRGLAACRCARCVAETAFLRRGAEEGVEGVEGVDGEDGVDGEVGEEGDDGDKRGERGEGEKGEDGEDGEEGQWDGADDADGGTLVDIPLETLRMLANLAAEDQRHGDALELLGEILSRHPTDGDALYSRSRITGWNDEWSEAQRLLLAASELAPDHPELRQKISEMRKYYPMDSPTVDSTIVESPMGVVPMEPPAGPGEAAGATGATLTFPAPVAPAESPAVSPVETVAPVAALLAGPLTGRAFVEPGILDRGECSQAIADVEAHIAEAGGWMTSRHYSVPTTDVPVHQVPTVLAWFNRNMRDVICPMLGAQFGVRPAAIRVIDAFVVKYNADSQRSLPLHCDQSQFSLTIAMNPMDEYDGGGTYFDECGEVLNSDAGGVISFRGELLHGGHPITRGTRYIVVAFLWAYEEANEGGEEGERGDGEDIEDAGTGYG